jgi:YHS domain-containing protein
MIRSARLASVTLALTLVTTLCLWETASGDEARLRDIPAPFVPFEYLIGRWNGQGVPKDNPAKQFRGWTETHTWAWAFAQGKLAGMTLTIDGGKVLASGKLTYDVGRKLFHLDGIEPAPSREKLTFEGNLDKTGKYLVLDHVAAAVGKPGKSPGALRLSIWPNANFIRYTMAHELKEPGSIQFTRLIEVGLTKDGESLAGAASGTSEPPRCVVTGGAASMTMTYQGRTFPICCTGCRDEFNENPEKYIKKASLMSVSQAAKSKAGQPTSTGVSRFEDAFAGDVADPPTANRPTTGGANKTLTKGAAAAESTPVDSKISTAKTSTKDNGRPGVTKPAARAASLLKLGQSLEKSGKTAAALGYYRQVTKDFANTPAAKTAAERIKALDKP